MLLAATAAFPLLFAANPAYGDGAGGANSAALGSSSGLNGGAGGGGGAGGIGGAGSSNVSAGSNGSATGSGGAGSGGTSSLGESGGGAGGAGGAAGTAASPTGGNGGAGGIGSCAVCLSGFGGGGGGGGGDGFDGSSLSGVAGAITGGKGGNGGSVSNASAFGSDGGAGGGGGAGAVLSGSGSTSASANITGGAGGSGGAPLGGGGAGFGGGGGSGVVDTGVNLTNGFTITGGAGGAGGAGLSAGTGRAGGAGAAGVTGSGFTLTNTGTIQGGNGGATGANGAGTGTGSTALGGAGVVGSSLTIVNGGTIAGGVSGNGSTLANAITFTGGTNSLELDQGWSFSGNVVTSSGATAALILGGNTTDLTSNAAGTSVSTVFALSQIGTVFQGFTSFAKTGTSTWALTGSTSTATPWTISAGTLQLGNGTTNGSITGNVTDNATFAFDPASGTTMTESGVISGTGQVTQVGTGITVLSGVNSYTGGTTISAGTLQVSADGNLGGSSGALTINGGTLNTTASFASSRATTLGASGGTFDVDPGTTLTMSGVISGTGSLATVDTGTLLLTGANTYTVGTTISAGTLQLGNGTTNGSIVGNVTDNATLVFDPAASSTLVEAGVISGSGAVQQIGTGTTVLTGANSYSGGTTISTGTLQLGDGTTDGSITGNVADNATLAFDPSAGSTLAEAAVISGSGVVTQIGAGTTVLSGANSYSGGTTISDGTLELTTGTAAGTGTVTVSTTAGDTTQGLDLDFTSAGTFANTLAGSGVTTVAAGSGLATLTGANAAYTGDWQIDGDAAIAPASTTSNTNLGSGTVNIASGGSLAVTTTGAFSFNNALTSSGTLTASNGGAAFSFGTNTGSAFTGTVALSNDTFALSGTNTTALTNATLSLGTGSVTTVGDGNQSIGALTFNGGTAVFDGTAPAQQVATSLITTGSLNVSGTGVVRINVPNPYTPVTPTPSGDLSLFQQSHVDNGLELVSATSVTGNASGLTLENQSSTPISATQNVDVDQGGNLVAIGTYGYSLSTGTADNGLYVGYALNQLALQAGQSLTLTEDPGATGNDADMAAQLTGSGNLVIAANNVVSLSNANNTFTGTTTVQSGTLQANAANVIALSSAVNIDAASTFDTNGFSQSVNNLTGAATANVLLSGGDALTLNGSGTPNTFAGTISGDGSVVQASGTEVLTGTNTYSGGTTINGGTLQVSADDNLGASTGTLTLDGGTLNTTASFATSRATTLGTSGGTFDVDPGTSLTMGGVTSGAGALTKTNTGTLILTGANSYAGGTTIDGGTLQLGDGTNNGSITGDVVDDATLAFDPAASTTMTSSGVISGTGVVSQIGVGTTVLSGTNTYSGGTTISDGTLQLTTGTAAGTGAVAVNTTAGDTTQGLNLDFASAGTFANTLAGSGTTTIAAGSGAATIAGSNSGYAGNWQINGSAAVAPASTTSNTNLGSGTVNIASGGSLAVTTTGAFSFDNALTGSGTLSASNGGGAFSFSSGAGSAFQGTVALSNDTFALSGTNTTALTNATLSLGTGSVTTVGDGNQSIGALTFDGGTAVFDGTAPAQQVATSLITTGALNVSGTGVVRINVPNPYAPVTPTPSGDLSLLQQSHVNNGLELVSATSVTGNASGLTLENQNGTPISATQNVNIDQSGNLVAIGTYGYSLSTGTADNGLYVGYTLNQLALQAGQSLTLTEDPGATGNNADMAAQLTGSGNLIVAANNLISLSNTANTFTGTTTVQSGTLQADAANVIASSSAVDIVASTTFDTNGFSQSLNNLTGAATANILLSGGDTLTLNGSGTPTTFAGTISGDGSLTQASGTEILTGTNTYTGGTTIGGGTLQLGNGTTNGSITGNVTDDATLAFDPAGTTAMTGSNVISGSGAVSQIGTGTTVLTGVNTYTGATTINAGTLQLGDGTTNGSIAGNVTDNATFAFDPASGSTLATPGAISGAGVIDQLGAGTTNLTGNSSTFSGTTNVTDGSLEVSGTIGGNSSTVNVSSGGTLGGSGTVGGNVNIADGTLAPGNADFGGAPGTLAIGGNLALTSASTLDYHLGEANVVGGPSNDLTTVGGNLTLAGTVNVSTPVGSFDPGLYRIISYNGTLTNNGLTVGSVTAGGSATVQTSIAGEVNLVNTSGTAPNFWDGGLSSSRNDGIIEGGDGTWQSSAGNDNWTTQTGSLNAPYPDGTFAIFAANAGTVTVDDSLGAVVSGGMQFATDGYLIAGSPITMAAGTDLIRVGDGTAAGAGYTATIASQLTGSGGIDKDDLGTLVLTGANDYTGGTTVSNGTLQLGDGTTNGSVIGNITDNAALAFDPASGTTMTEANVISGSGVLQQIGAGTTVLTGVNTYTGGTTVSAGTLQLGDGTTDGSITGNIADNATLAFDPAAGTAIASAGVISGTGQVTQTGTGTTVLSGANTYTGGTTATAGTLQVSADDNLGASTGALTLDGATLNTTASFASTRATTLGAGGGTFDVDPGTTLTMGGAISGAGALTTTDAGTLILSSADTYAGGTTLDAGTLQLGDGTTNGSITGNVTDNATLTFDPAAGSTLTESGVISGSGALEQIGAGTTNLTGDSGTLSGPVSVTAGTLEVSGSLGNASSSVSVASGGTLGGSGTLGGNVSITNGTLAPGNEDFGGGPGTLAIGGNLALTSASTLDYHFGEANVVGGPFNDLTTVGGNLTLAGTLNVSAPSGGFDPGIYRVIGYSGTLTDNGLAPGAVPAGTAASVQTSIANEVNLVNSTGVATNFWDGGSTSSKDDGVIEGGNGRWQSPAGNDDWAGTNGAFNVPYTNAAFAIFAAAPGTVTVDDSLGAVVSGGMQFATTGYQIQGSPITMAAGSNLIRVGDGTSAGASYVATIASPLTGSGGIDKSDLGTLVLSGANSYTGGTTVSAGTLQLQGAGTLGATSNATTVSAGTLDLGGTSQTQDGGLTLVSGAVNDGTLSSSSSFALESGSVSASLAGGGALDKTTSGTVILTGVNAYTGATTISGGTLALGHGGSVAASSGVALAAAGSVFDISAGGNQTIKDLSSVAGSTVNVGANTLSFGTADSTTFAGSFAGTGGLDWQGDGTLSLTGDSSGYAGTTTIAAGTVAIGTDTVPNASLGGNVDVPGGTLKGFGTIGGNLVNTGGTVQPGGSIGTLSVGGNYTQRAGGTLAIEVSPTSASQLKVGGTATIDGKLALLFAPGTYTPTSYRLLTAQSVSGAFSQVSGTNPSGLIQSINYNPADVTLQLSAPHSVAPIDDTIYTTLTSMALLNAQQVNGILLDRIGQRRAGIADGPIAGSSDPPTPVQTADATGDGPLMLAPSPASRGAWFRGIGNFTSLSGRDGVPGFTGSTGGFLFGYDQPIDDTTYLGAAAGYLNSSIDEHSPSSGTLQSARIAMYGGVVLGPSLITATAGYAHDWMNTTRGIAGVGTASESHGGDEATFAGQWSMPLTIPGLAGGSAMLTPKAGIQYVHLSEGAFADNGAGNFDLAANGHSADSLQPYFGFAVSQHFATRGGTEITPELRIGYAYETLSNARNLSVLATDGTAFAVNGIPPSRNQLSAGLGVSMTAGPNLSFYASYDAILPVGNTRNQTFQAGLRWKF